MSVHQCAMHGCGCDCTIGSDAFAGDLSQWTVTGSAAISGGVLQMHADGDQVIFTPVPTSANAGVHLTFELTNTGDGVFRVLVAWEDASNYLFAELSRASGVLTLQLRQKLAGTISDLTDTLAVADSGSDLDDPHTVEVCWQPGNETMPENLETGWVQPQQVDGDTWISPTNAMVCNDETPTIYNLDPADSTDILFFFDWPLSLPGGCTITGIEFALQDQQSGNDDVTDQSVLLDLDVSVGSPVGDNKATGRTVVEGAYGGAVYGGSSDDWNAGITQLQASQVNFGFQVTYVHADPDVGATLLVDCASANFHYTTADRTAGRLTVTWKNNAGDAELQCLTDRGVFPTEGLKAGLLVVSGDWDVDDWVYSYRGGACPDCDCASLVEPCDCCDPDFPPAASYVLDIGSPFTGDEGCEDCTDFSGEYEVVSTDDCRWEYSEVGKTCTDNDITFPRSFGILLQLASDGLGGCLWRATIFVGRTGAVDPAQSSVANSATYESGTIDTDQDCQTMPLTLDFIGVSAFSGACDVDWPLTVTLDLP